MRNLISVLIVISALMPASAAIARADDNMRVCRLDWVTTSGPIQIKREYDASGILVRQSIGASMLFPSSPWGISGLNVLNADDGAQPEFGGVSYSLSAHRPSPWPRRLRLELDVAGVVLTIPVDRKAGAIAISGAQALAILEVQGPVTYRFYKAGNKPSEPLEEGVFDTRGHSPGDLKGMGGLIKTASEALSAAESGPNPPCVETDDEYIVDRWLGISCEEQFTGTIGPINLKPNRFNVDSSQIAGAVFNIAARINGGSNTDSIDFTGANMLPRGVLLWAYGDEPQWQKNIGKPADDWTQALKITSGGSTLSGWMFDRPRYDLFYNDEKIATEIFAANSKIDVSIYDSDSDQLQTLEFAAGWRDALEADLRAGWRRLKERERDPASQCDLNVYSSDRHIII